MKRIINKKKIDSDKYVNVDTGETLTSEFGGDVGTLNKVNSDYVRMQSKDFFIIEKEAVDYLEGVLSKGDMGYVYMMCKMVYGCFNLLHDKNVVVHSKQTLMADLDLARNAFGRLMNRLEDKGVLYFILGKKDGKRVKYIMLNPNLARKTNTLHNDCVNNFQSFGTTKP